MKNMSKWKIVEKPAGKLNLTYNGYYMYSNKLLEPMDTRDLYNLAVKYNMNVLSENTTVGFACKIFSDDKEKLERFINVIESFSNK